jgi:nucleotide-binding universal stress UspA family protein
LTIDVRRDALGADDVTAGLAHGLNASLVMVATDGHNRELHGHTGHVATELVRHSHCPVVVRHLPV